MTIHPAIKTLEQEIEKLRKNADSYSKDGMHTVAYLERRRVEGLEAALDVIKPWLRGETEL